MTGYDDFSYAVEMLRNGVREYLLKPIEREQILSIMQLLNKEIQENRTRGKSANWLSTASISVHDAGYFAEGKRTYM